MNKDASPPPKPVKLKKDGTPDGRGHAEGSKDTRFADNDGRRRPGRPKGSVSLKTAYQRTAAMIVEYTDGNGSRRRIPTPDYIARKVREKALKGDLKAIARLEDRIAEYCPEPVDPLSTTKLLAEDAEILARAVARGVLPPTTNEEGDKPS